MNQRTARAWQLLTSGVAVTALVFQLVLILQGKGVLDETEVPAKPEQVRRFCFYFTIQSNALVAWTCWVVGRGAAQLPRDHRAVPGRRVRAGPGRPAAAGCKTG